MARLLQNNQTTTTGSSVGPPSATTHTVSPGVQTSTTPQKRRARRYPRWFVPLFLAAAVLTGGELCYRGGHWAHQVALDTGQASQTRYALAPPKQNSAWYAVSPKGDRFLVGYASETGVVNEVRNLSGTLLWKTTHHQAVPAFSANGARVFIGSKVLHADTGKLEYEIPLKETMNQIAWDQRGQIAAWGASRAVHVWNKGAKKRLVLPIPETFGSSSEVRVSPDGKWVAMVASNWQPEESQVLLWNLAAPSKPQVFPVWRVSGSAFGLAFSPDSKMLLYTGRKRGSESSESSNWVGAWTVSTGQAVLDALPEKEGALAGWSADSKYAVVRGFQQWEVYDVLAGKRVWQTPSQENSFVNNIVFAADNKLYFYDHDRRTNRWALKYWDLSKVLAKAQSGG